jgi:hypothetical protein
MIANGYLRLDREEWFKVVEKRRDAQAVPPGGATVCRGRAEGSDTSGPSPQAPRRRRSRTRLTWVDPLDHRD